MMEQDVEGKKSETDDQALVVQSDVGSRILYEDERTLVVNKLAGEAVEGAARGHGDLRLGVRSYLGTKRGSHPEPFAEAPHRVDVPVSGCVIFALDQGRLAELSASFSAGTIEKIYWAIVEKPLPSSAGDAELSQASDGAWRELVHWLSFDAKRNKSRAWTERIHGRKRSVLRYRLVGQGDRYAFLEIKLLTGRHHQIRCQLAAVGLPIKGDLKYGAKRSESSGGIRLAARRLRFSAGAGGKSIDVTAPLPEGDALWAAFVEAAAGAAAGASAAPLASE